MAISQALLFVGRLCLLMIVLFSFGCRLQSWSGKEATMTDAILVYQWNTGSIPPPDYYEYEILVRPTQEGEIRFRPDYPVAAPPTWEERFKISESDYSSLIKALHDFTEVENETGPHTGGSLGILHLQESGCPPVVHRLYSDQGRKVEQMIKNLVPHDTWQRLLDMFESYRKGRR